MSLPALWLVQLASGLSGPARNSEPPKEPVVKGFPYSWALRIKE